MSTTGSGWGEKRIATTILVVDDQAPLRRLLTTILSGAGYEVVETGSGASALDLLAHGTFDLVLLDRRMPGMGGLEVLEILRSRPETRTLPVILLSAADELSERVSGLDAGATDYITKPFENDDLLARVRSQLRDRKVWQELVQNRLRGRATVAEGLARAAIAPPEGRAQTICDELIGLETVQGAALVWFTNERAALPIAAAGTSAWNLRIGEPAPRSLARYLATRAAIGPWIERGDIVGIDVDRGAPDALLLADPAACAPLGKLGEPLGMLVLAAEPGASIADVDDTLAAAIDFASMATKLLHADLEARRRNQAERSGVAETLLNRAYVSCFQPIRSLDDDVIVGFEALTRFADLTPPAWRFAEAQRVGLGIELEQATILSALAAAAQLPARRWVSVNASPALVLAANGALTEALRTADRNIVVELTEHDPVEDYDMLRSALNRLGADVLLSVDDAGSGFASLRHVLILEPDFIKLDQSWVRGIDTDRARQALVAGLQSFAAKTECRLIAEGIETEAERQTLVELNVPLGQGFLLGAPAPPTS